MKNKIIFLLFFLSCFPIFGASIPASWLLNGEEMPINKSEEEHFRPTLENILDFSGEVLEEFKQKERPLRERKFNFTEVTTYLGVSTGGTIGILGLSGDAVAELHWAKKNHKNHQTRQKNPNLKITATTVELNLIQSIEPLVDMLVESGEVKKENKKKLTENLFKAATSFQKIMNGVSLNYQGIWVVKAIQANIGVEASGAVDLFQIGGAVNLTFEWSFEPTNITDITFTTREKTEEEIFQTKMSQMIKVISEEISIATNESPKIEGFKIGSFQIGFAVGISGEMGVATLGASAGLTVVFASPNLPLNEVKTLKPINSNQGSLITLVGNDSTKRFRDRMEERRNFKFAKVIRKKFRKGLKRALKIGSFLANTSFNRENRLIDAGKTPNFSLSGITTSFSLNLEGSVGVLTIAGTSGLEIELIRENL